MTIPLRWGEGISRAIAALLLLVFFLLPGLTISVWSRTGLLWLAPSMLFMAAGALAIIRRARGAPTLLKIGMLFAMIAASILYALGDLRSALFVH